MDNNLQYRGFIESSLYRRVPVRWIIICLRGEEKKYKWLWLQEFHVQQIFEADGGVIRHENIYLYFFNKHSGIGSHLVDE